MLESHTRGALSYPVCIGPGFWLIRRLCGRTPRHDERTPLQNGLGLCIIKTYVDAAVGNERTKTTRFVDANK